MTSLIGPHEGKEFDLLATGEKNVALFYEIIPDEYYSFKALDEYDCIEFSKSAIRTIDKKIITIPYVILYKTEFEADAKRLYELNVNIIPNEQSLNIDYEREIGSILGYPKEAIDYYIEKLTGNI